MTLKQFKHLSEADQEEEVWSYAIHLRNYVDGNVITDVYKLYDFNVKYCIHITKNDEPEMVAVASCQECNLSVLDY